MYSILLFLFLLISGINSAPTNNCTKVYKTTVIDNLADLHGEYSLVYLWSPFPFGSKSFSEVSKLTKATTDDVLYILKKCSYIPLIGHEVKLKITKGDKQKFLCSKYDSKFVIEDDCNLVKFEIVRVTSEFLLVLHPDVPSVAELIGTRQLNAFEVKCMVSHIDETMKLKPAVYY